MTSATANKPIIVQSDGTVLLEVDNPLYESARDDLARFAELERSPEHIHTYRITPLSLWNAAASGLDPDAITHVLETFAKYPVPNNVRVDIADYISRYGRVKLIREDTDLILVSDTSELAAELSHHKQLQTYIIETITPSRLRVDSRGRRFPLPCERRRAQASLLLCAITSAMLPRPFTLVAPPAEEAA